MPPSKALPAVVAAPKRKCTQAGFFLLIRSNLSFLFHVWRLHFFYLSPAALPSAETVSLFFSAPILITILSAAFLFEKVEIRSWIAVLVGFLGVIIMITAVDTHAAEPMCVITGGVPLFPVQAFLRK
jgi:drug/metabolite transporter (DMT)-like permease